MNDEWKSEVKEEEKDDEEWNAYHTTNIHDYGHWGE